ncbi:Lrp/AsnC family transcriptional regulator [Candidatus Woesearchaeota archaeon]|nr:Lrp/AsnC family transcriptional regulator [Candidatus Woesearchaeota archaeon]
MADLDKKDCLILGILQKNCRTSLTDIAKEINLSIDSVKKRIKKMEKKGIFYPKIQIRPRSLGFVNIVDVKIKLNNHSKKDIDSFINYLIENPRISEIFGISGEYDLSIVILSKDAKDLQNITSAIQNKFGEIINSWNESMTLIAHKFEKYDMNKLLGLDNQLREG